MPREVLIRFTAPESVTGVPVGSTKLVFGIDADEYVQKKLAVIENEFPPPRSWLLTDGLVDPGVLAGSQTKMSESEKKSEQEFLLDQVRAADRKHEAEQEQKRLKDAVAGKRKAVAHE